LHIQGTTLAASGNATVGASLAVSGSVTVGNFTSGNVAPLPTSSSGVGQFVDISGVATYTLPSGGTWLYFGVQHDQRNVTSNMPVFSTSGIASGGTLIMTDGGLSYRWYGFAWRIS
jgi:hypothetical protein